MTLFITALPLLSVSGAARGDAASPPHVVTSEKLYAADQTWSRVHKVSSVLGMKRSVLSARNRQNQSVCVCVCVCVRSVCPH